MPKWNSCPSCGHRPGSGLFSGNWFPVYQCKKCRKTFCHKCGLRNGEECPSCGSREKQKVGEVYR